MTEQDLVGKSPQELIELLYARVCRDLDDARILLAADDRPASQADAIHMIVHAQQIIAELNRCVNQDKGGDLAANLSRVYEYMQSRLTEAVSKRDVGPVHEVLGLVTELHQAWKTMLELPVKNNPVQA
jgi:flagellar protein FliS